MEPLVKNVIKGLLPVFFFFSACVCFAQEADHGIRFTHQVVRNNKVYVSPTGFIARGGEVNSFNEKTKGVGCYFGTGWVRFKVIDSHKIDSISIEGRMPESFKTVYLRGVKQSERYWECLDCAEKKKGYWIIIPILIGYSAGCSEENKAEKEMYFALHHYYYDMFQSWNRPDRFGFLKLGERTLLLDPIEEIAME